MRENYKIYLKSPKYAAFRASDIFMSAKKDIIMAEKAEQNSALPASIKFGIQERVSYRLASLLAKFREESYLAQGFDPLEYGRLLGRHSGGRSRRLHVATVVLAKARAMGLITMSEEEEKLEPLIEEARGY